MRYGGSEAYDLEAYELGGAAWEQQERIPLWPIEGGRLDARARREMSPALTRLIGYVAALFIALFVAGGVSVALTSGTVALLQANSQTNAAIKEISTQNDGLRIERSQLTRADRITRIATQNLDMVYANDAHIISID